MYTESDSIYTVVQNPHHTCTVILMKLTNDGIENGHQYILAQLHFHNGSQSLTQAVHATHISIAVTLSMRI